MTLQPADLAHYQAGRSGNTLVDPHAFVTSVILGGAGASGQRPVHHCLQKCAGGHSGPGGQGCAAWPSSSGKNTRMRP